MDDYLNYGQIMQRALRGVMADALGQVQEQGLAGEHHFYITFDVRNPQVEMPDFLRAEYPDQITIVLEHEFDDLTVSPEGFSVRMSFSNRPTRLYVPFDSVLTFVDPSVEFGLKFEVTEVETPDEPEPETTAEPAEEGSAEVVSLDQFRKR
ncbi:MAG: SspB family protein [Pikeienuella sp.]